MKKIISLILALTLIFTMCLNAFATSVGDVTGDGTIDWEDVGKISVIEVDVPTDVAWDFLIDPLGFANLIDGGTFDPNLTTSSALIFGGNEALYIISTSSDDTLVNLNVAVNITSGGAVLVENESEIQDNNTSLTPEPTLFIQVASNENRVDYDTNFEDGFSGTIGRAVTETGTDYEYVLKASEWEYISNSYVVDGKTFWDFEPELKADEAGDGTLIYPTGVISPKGNWSDYTSKVNKVDPLDPSSWTVTAPSAEISISATITAEEIIYGDGDGETPTFTNSQYADYSAIEVVADAYALLAKDRATGSIITNIVNDTDITADAVGMFQSVGWQQKEYIFTSLPATDMNFPYKAGTAGVDKTAVAFDMWNGSIWIDVLPYGGSLWEDGGDYITLKIQTFQNLIDIGKGNYAFRVTYDDDSISTLGLIYK